jgi:activator of HSP90 ATPase
MWAPRANHSGNPILEETMSNGENLAALANARTRRQAIAGVAVAFGGLAAGVCVWGKAQDNQEKIKEPQSTGVEGLLTYIHQEVDFKASRQRVYDTLLDSKQFAAFTGMPAEISREAGGTVSMFGGLIVGRNIELVPRERIVQAWRPSAWEPGVYSLVKFELKDWASQTKVILDHTGFPEGSFRHLDSGWYLRYWEPLRKYLA